MAKRLVRSKKNRIFLGVLGGIAEHLNVDPTLVRLIFIVLLVFNPVTMALVYFLAALVIPEEGEEEEKPISEKVNELANETGERINEIFSGNENTKAVAIILIVLGALLLLGPFFPLVVPVVGTRTLLAVVLLVVGILLLVRGE